MDERRDDWRRGVDENLASLNAGQRVHDNEINRLWKARAADDKLLRGDTEKDTDGLIARLHNAENTIQMLKAVIDVDKAGNRGLIHRIEQLEGDEKTAIDRIKYWTAVIGVIGLVAAAVIGHIDKIAHVIGWNAPPSELSKKIERAKRPRGKPVVRYRIIQKAPAPEPESVPEEPEEERHQ